MLVATTENMQVTTKQQTVVVHYHNYDDTVTKKPTKMAKTFDELLALDDFRRSRAKHALQGRSTFLSLFVFRGTLFPRLMVDPMLWAGWLVYFVMRLITATYSIGGLWAFQGPISTSPYHVNSYRIDHG